MKVNRDQVTQPVTIKLWTVVILVILCLFIGGLLGRKTAPTTGDRYQFKYDSIESANNQAYKIMEHAVQQRDSARSALSDIKFKFDSIEKLRRVETKAHLAEMQKQRESWQKMTDDELAKEAIKLYEKAHPTPLFDNND